MSVRCVLRVHGVCLYVSQFMYYCILHTHYYLLYIYLLRVCMILAAEYFILLVWELHTKYSIIGIDRIFCIAINLGGVLTMQET